MSGGGSGWGWIGRDLDPPRVTNIEVWTKQVATQVNRLTQEANRIRQVEAEMKARDQLDLVKELMDKQHAHQSAYNTVIIGVGYAGFFALWNLVKDGDRPGLHAFAGLMIAVSLILYVGWEVGQMIYRTVQLQRITQELETGSRVDQLQVFADGMRGIERRAFRWWPVVLVPCVVTGLVGGAALLFVFVLDLIDNSGLCTLVVLKPICS